MSSAVWVALSDLFHRGQQEAFRQRVSDCQRLICGISYAGSVALLGYSSAFIGLWVGDVHYGGHGMTLAFALTVPVLGMQAFHGWLLTATGHTRVYLLGVALHCMAMFLACGFLGATYGPTGVAWGVFAATAGVLTSCNLCALHRVLRLPWRDLLGPYVGATLLALPLGAAAWWLARLHTPRNWLALAAEMAATALVYLALWWQLLLPVKERQMWLSRARSFWRSREAPSGEQDIQEPQA